MAVKVFFWDFGGVIVRTYYPEHREALAKQFGMSRKELETLVFSSDSGESAQLGIISYEQHWKNIQTELNLSDEEILSFQMQFWEADRMDEQLINAIRTLRRNYRTGLISNAFSDLNFHLRETLGIAEIFDEIIISAEIGMVKPDPGIYYYALERLNCKPEEAVFIDDKLENIVAAQQIGMHGIHFLNTMQTLTELENLINPSIKLVG